MKKKRQSNENDNQDNKARNPRKRSLTDRILLAAAVILLIGAAGLLLKGPIENYRREQQTESMLEQIKGGEETIVVDPNALPVSGEGYEFFEETFPMDDESQYTSASVTATSDTSATEAATPTPVPKKVVLNILGTIRIDAIDLDLPLIDGATVIPLRYGAGVVEGTARPGEEGNCVVLGHRMKTYGSLFNRLNEVEVGDSIDITMTDGSTYAYVVDNVIPMLDPAELGNYISRDSGSGTQMTLVTCTPKGVGSHRIIVIAHIV